MLGDNIRRIRLDHHLTQKELGDILHVTQGAVSQWEKGLTRPDTNQLRAIAGAFNVSLDDLTANDPIPSFRELSIEPVQSPLTPTEEQMILDYRSLNHTGQNRIRMILDEYLQIYDYSAKYSMAGFQ